MTATTTTSVNYRDGNPTNGEFNPLMEAVKAARECSAVIGQLLTFRSFPRGDGRVDHATETADQCLTLAGRASMAMEMVSGTAFGEAVREAMVRSPSGKLREFAMNVLSSLAEVDREIAGEAGGGGGGGGGCGAGAGRVNGFVSLTTFMVGLFCEGGCGGGYGWLYEECVEC